MLLWCSLSLIYVPCDPLDDVMKVKLLFSHHEAIPLPKVPSFSLIPYIF